MNKYIKSFPIDHPKRKMLQLEKEYRITLEKRTLRWNIFQALGIEHSAGDIYPLQDVGKVLGVTRERVRQLETGALKRLSVPENTRVLKEYLYDMQSTGGYDGHTVAQA